MMLQFTIVILFVLKPTICQRRIVNGQKVDSDARYMVYLVKAPESEKKHDAWICGGCIIHPLLILTSAACLVDVQYMYAIAGYNKYIKADQIETDECTKRTKRKIVHYYISRDYNMEINNNYWWNAMDIGIGKVDFPFDFNDKTYLAHCSYIPNQIRVGYNEYLSKEGTQCITLGWGSSKYYRPVGNTNDYNEEYLRFASVTLSSKDKCLAHFTGSNKDIFDRNVHHFWVCALEEGFLEVDGTLKDRNLTGCDMTQRMGRNGECNDKKEKEPDYDFDFRRYTSENKPFPYNLTRRHGPCQNDHGGPLVTWFGGHAYVIGVVSAFIVNAKMECQAPFMFSSVYCHSIFLKCVLDAYYLDADLGTRLESNRRSSLCDAPAKERGFDMSQKNISWPH